MNGISSIDFQGIGSMSGDIGGSAAADIVWDNMPWSVNAATLAVVAKMSVEQFKASVANALSSDYRMVQSSSAPSNAVDSSVLSSQYPDAASYIKTAFENMQSKGYWIVPNQPAQKSQPVTPSIAYQGAVAAQQGLQRPTTQIAPQSPSHAFPSIQWKTFAPPTTTYIRQPYAQTPADRQRLIWIIGGFGLLFAITIGVIAARE